jgi:hypothetical protein
MAGVLQMTEDGVEKCDSVKWRAASLRIFTSKTIIKLFTLFTLLQPSSPFDVLFSDGPLYSLRLVTISLGSRAMKTHFTRFRHRSLQ